VAYLGLPNTLVLSFLVTESIVFARVISILEALRKFIEYFLHERAWSWIPWDYQRIIIPDQPE
jgi:uncharacterized membrane protein